MGFPARNSRAFPNAGGKIANYFPCRDVIRRSTNELRITWLGVIRSGWNKLFPKSKIPTPPTSLVGRGQGKIREMPPRPKNRGRSAVEKEDFSLVRCSRGGSGRSCSAKARTEKSGENQKPPNARASIRGSPFQGARHLGQSVPKGFYFSRCPSASYQT